MKNFLLYILFLLTALSVRAQSTCFITLGDATGIDITSQELSQLEAAACALIDSLPAEFRDSFKVFDAGFYILNSNMIGEFERSWDLILNKASSLSNFYLIFGRYIHPNGEVNLIIDLRLSQKDSISCVIDELEIKKNLGILVSGILKVPSDFYKAEISALKLFPKLLVTCEICDNGIDDDGDGLIDCEVDMQIKITV